MKSLIIVSAIAGLAVWPWLRLYLVRKDRVDD